MINGINHITLSVTDIDRAFDFYINTLKIKPVMKSSHSMYALAGNTWLAFVEEDAKTSDSYQHIAFNIDEKDYHQFVDKLKKAGVDQWKENTTEGESFYFRDPFGNRLELHYSTIENRIDHAKQNWGKDVEWFI